MKCDTDPEAWFSSSVTERRDAQVDCMGCPLIDSCEQGAHDRDERWGVWGGKDFTVTGGPRRLIRPKQCAWVGCRNWFFPRRGENNARFASRLCCSSSCANRAGARRRAA